MKKILLTFLTLFITSFGVSIFAQGKYGADSAECIKYLSYYKEYFKQKNYNDAIPNWRKAFKYCPPTANQTMLVDGTSLYRKLIAKNFNNVTYRKALIDSLMMLHDVRMQNYPKYAVTVLNNKGLDMANYIKDDYQTLYDGYNAIIAANQEKTKSNIFLFDMNAAIQLFKDNKLEAEEVIATYQNLIALLDKANPAEAEQNAKVKSDIEGLFISSRVASCDNLIALFTPRFNAEPENLELVTNIVKMMGSTENCTNNQLYLDAVNAMHKLNPSYTSAYYLYKLYSSRDNFVEGVKYLEEAIAYEESDANTDADYNIELATYCLTKGASSKAFEAAKKAIGLNPALSGKAYYLMGTIWGTTSCGGDEVARRAPYWVAVDYLTKAKNADPSLAEDCNKLINQYSAYFPQTAEAFMYNLMDGQSYTISCNGMRAVTTVRTQK